MYDKIIKFLEDNHSTLYTIIKDLGLSRALIPRKNGGITFIVPHKNLLKSIYDFAYNDEESRAVEIINSLIILDCLDTVADWDRKRSDIPNKLKQKIAIDRVNTHGVKLKNGAIIKPSKFVATKDRNNLSVWNLISGEIGSDGKPTDFKYNSKKTSNSKYVSNGVERRRAELAHSLESAFDKTRNTEKYLIYMSTLLQILKDEDRGLYNKIRPMIDASPVVSFYILVEPYKGDNGMEYLIPGFIIQKCKTKFPNALSNWKSHFKLSDSDEAKDAVAEALNCVEHDDAKKQIKNIKVEYAKFDAGEGLGSTFPKSTMTHYQMFPGLKKWQDCARHIIRQLFRLGKMERVDMMNELFDVYNPENFNTLITDMSYYKRAGTLEIYQAMTGKFVRSDLFMYYPHKPHITEDENTDYYIDYSGHTWENLDDFSDKEDMETSIERQMRMLQENNPEKYERLVAKYQKKKEGGEKEEGEKNESE